MAHTVEWYSPAPLWSTRLENGTQDRLRRPALLEFKQDDFMGELQTTLDDAPNELVGKLARGEASGGENGTSTKGQGAVPLYQPAHERYYLVTASLVCRERGLPDRSVDTTNEERTSFLLRRLVPVEADEDERRTHEYGWFGDEWRPIAEEDRRRVQEGEEPRAMFPQTYEPTALTKQTNGMRRVWAGFIPAAKRDTFATAPVRHRQQGEMNGDEGSISGPRTSTNPLSDPRMTAFHSRVLQAFKELRDTLQTSGSVTASDVQGPLLFAWLDLWQFLDTHLPTVAATIERGGSAADAQLGDERKADLVDRLNEMDMSGMELGSTAADVLRSVASNRRAIEVGELDTVVVPGDLNLTEIKEALDTLLAPNVVGESLMEERPALQGMVRRALGELGDPSSLPDDLQPPSADPTSEAQYVVRCVYERPNCPPQRREVVSERSRPFQLASFFDANAPARDINITLPGTSLSDLRDSSQSVTMVFTKELRNQAERVQELTLQELQDGNAGSSPGLDIGMICSLSIPIITICALILLLIIVTLLNIVFWWLPFFKICFPLPQPSE